VLKDWEEDDDDDNSEIDDKDKDPDYIQGTNLYSISCIFPYRRAIHLGFNLLIKI